MKKFKDLTGFWKAVIILWSIVITLLIVLFIILSRNQVLSNKSEIEENTKAKSEIEIITEGSNLTNTEAQETLKDLKDVGTGTIISCRMVTRDYDNITKEESYQGLLDLSNKFLEVKDENYSYIITYKEGKIYTIFYDDNLLFMNYGVSHMDCHKLTDEEITIFCSAAKKHLEEFLKAPTTAEYNENIKVIRTARDIVTVKSSVDSQNSFGAIIRSDFVVQMKYFSKGKELIYVEIDNEPIYGMEKGRESKLDFE